MLSQGLTPAGSVLIHDGSASWSHDIRVPSRQVSPGQGQGARLGLGTPWLNSGGPRWVVGTPNWGWTEDIQHQPHDTSRSQASASPSLVWPLLVLKTPAAGLPSPDRLGRQKVLIFNYLQTAVSGTCAAFAPNFPAYCAFRFLSGMSTAGVVLNCMTLSEGPGRAGQAPTLTLQPPSPTAPFQPPLPAHPSGTQPVLPLQPTYSLHPGAHTILTSSLDTQLQTPLLGPGSSHK